MNTNQDAQITSKRRSIRDSLRLVWQDSARAHRALLRVEPYDDYLRNHRNEY